MQKINKTGITLRRQAILWIRKSFDIQKSKWFVKKRYISDSNQSGLISLKTQKNLQPPWQSSRAGRTDGLRRSAHPSGDLHPVCVHRHKVSEGYRSHCINFVSVMEKLWCITSRYWGDKSSDETFLTEVRKIEFCLIVKSPTRLNPFPLDLPSSDLSHHPYHLHPPNFMPVTSPHSSTKVPPSFPDHSYVVSSKKELWRKWRFHLIQSSCSNMDP